MGIKKFVLSSIVFFQIFAILLNPIAVLAHAEDKYFDKNGFLIHENTLPVLIICSEENVLYNLYFETPYIIYINGERFKYLSNFAIVVGNPQSGHSLVLGQGSENRDASTGSIGYVSDYFISSGQTIFISPELYRYHSGIRRMWYSNPDENTITKEIPKACYKPLT